MKPAVEGLDVTEALQELHFLATELVRLVVKPWSEFELDEHSDVLRALTRLGSLSTLHDEVARVCQQIGAPCLPLSFLAGALHTMPERSMWQGKFGEWLDRCRELSQEETEHWLKSQDDDDPEWDED